MPNNTHTYIRPCRRCKKIFKPSGKRSFICPKCKIKSMKRKKKIIKKVKAVKKRKRKK